MMVLKSHGFCFENSIDGFVLKRKKQEKKTKKKKREMLKILPSSSLCPPLLLKKIDFKQKGVSDVTSKTPFCLKSTFLR
jgi:hypothetical protein